MIIDTLDRLKDYKSINKHLDKLIEFLNNTDVNALEKGMHVIIKDKLFVNVQNVEGRSKTEAIVEFHKEMIDIHIPLNGNETYGYVPVKQLPKVTFDEQNDFGVVLNFEPENWVTCLPGMFAVFFPQDGHAPCVANHKLHKLVFKIKVENEI